MTTPKCPLCGKAVKAVRSSGQTPLWRAGCFECMWGTALFSSTKQGALQEANELISKFPPIMRAQVGDVIKYSKGDLDFKLAKVAKKAMSDNGVLYLIVQRLDHPEWEEDINSTNIIAYPWELEQEGGRK